MPDIGADVAEKLLGAIDALGDGEGLRFNRRVSIDLAAVEYGISARHCPAARFLVHAPSIFCSRPTAKGGVRVDPVGLRSYLSYLLSDAERTVRLVLNG